MKSMKLMVISVICVSFIAALSGCKGNTNGPGSTEPTGNAVVQGYLFNYKGNDVLLGAKADDFIAAAGQPDDVFEAPSCAFDGVDKILYYPGFLINTFPDEGVDYILSVEIKDGGVYTAEGLTLGAQRADVIEKYGEAASETDTSLIYEKGDMTLSFIFENDQVSALTYYYKVLS